MFRSIINTTSKRLLLASAASTQRSFCLASASSLHNNQHNLFLSNSSPFNKVQQVKFYSHAPPLTKDIIKDRIVELLESYSKTKKDVTIDESSSFSKDLGLDSFDVVEVVMEIEYEFSIIIPDNDADEIKTVGQAVDYIAKQPDAC
ncbi:DEKNAAC100740 [Brettanomyces naardenensis]|uniref:Acyl carrier protein n=1 Tax=Brettanomyces naardenensis TaxID=13370 RepID=A0A448YFA0_BRENA|nr:DEKNAAC100740 [Brettanomyces naardenensis]